MTTFYEKPESQSTPYQWMDDANCRDLLGPFDGLTVEEQDALCDACPVQTICGEFEARTYQSPAQNQELKVAGWGRTARDRAAKRRQGLQPGKTCKHGHFIASWDDLYESKKGFRMCKKCSQVMSRAAYLRRKAKLKGAADAA